MQARSISRRILRAALLVVAALTLGAVTTIVVAGVFASRLTPVIRSGPETLRFPTNDRCGIAVHRLDRTGGVDITVATGAITRMGGPFDAQPGAVESKVPAWARDLLVPWGWDGAWQIGQSSNRHLVLRGWPWPAFAAVLRATGSTPEGPSGWTVVDGIDRSPPRASPWSTVVPETLPTRPIWSGLLLDSSLFAAIWFFLLLGSATFWTGARRRRRRRRGLCVACGYPASSSGGACPECGGTEG